MVQLATEAAILRIRTRDLGETVLDPELSCQRVYGSWVPFIVLNFEETVEAIKRSDNVSQVSFYKHYQILGGHNGRYLPKECYHPETGTAETAVYVQLSEEPVSEPRILVMERQDSDPHLNIVEKGLRGFRLLLAYVTFTSLEWASRGPLQINSCWVAGAGEALPRRRGILVLATNSNRNSTFQTSRPLPDAGL